MTERNMFKGKVPDRTVDNKEFSDFFFERAQRVEEEMPDMYLRVSNASREILRVDHYPGAEDFKVYIAPVKVKRGESIDHPILLTYCMWSRNKQMLYWPMDMIPLTNEERCSIWNDFVKDDEVYYSTREDY